LASGRSGGPVAVIWCAGRLSLLRTDVRLTGVRDEKELARLPAKDQQSWQKLWADVDQLYRQARANFTETQQKGTLTIQLKERAHETMLLAGKTYVIDLESKQFDAFLRLQDSQRQVLAENDDIEPGVNLNSRLAPVIAAQALTLRCCLAW